jgi:vitamin B12 transporter
MSFLSLPDDEGKIMTGFDGRMFAAALAASVGGVAVPAAAQESGGTIVVTASGQPQDRDESGQAITLIDADTIDRLGQPTVADLLLGVPSVRMNANGSLGSVTSLSLRGAEAGQTLVLIDGVRVNDPSGTSGAVDYGNLLAGNIRRIEVLRGSNAVPFGSDAIGGVINLTTGERDAPDGFALRLSGEGGHAGTARGTADLGWRASGLRVDAGLAGLHSDGISSAATRFGASERDGVDNLTAHLRVEAALSDVVTLDLRGYGVDARLDYDSFFGAPADSADTSHFRQVTGYAGLNARSLGGRLESRLALSWLANRRDYRFAPGTPVDFGYRGERWRLDYDGRLALGPSARLLFGLAHDAPDYRFFGFGSDERHSARTDSAYLMALLRPARGLTLTGGLRHDDHARFGGITTFGANANWGLADGHTRLRFAFGEGFRTPSLYQLHDGYVGNAALRPERATSYDLGLDRSFAQGAVRLGATLFARTTRHQIDYDFSANRYANLARTLAHGLEFSLDATLERDWRLAISYSLVATRDRTPGGAHEGQRLARRPLNSVSLALDKGWRGGVSAGATLRLSSGARDPLAPSGRLAGYALLGLRAALDLTKNIALNARLENAFDESYETSHGYSSAGRSAFAGVRMRW